MSPTVTACTSSIARAEMARVYLTATMNWSHLPSGICRNSRGSEEGFDAHRKGILVERLPEGVWTDQALEGKYQFERHIAMSAMAVVVVARHLQLDERVAIKFLSQDALRSDAAVTRFYREAQAAARIKNNHVVRIIDVASTTTGIPYIVMEFLDGHDLERLLGSYPNHQAPIDDAVDFILQASEAVSEGHSLGIIHRDLKPANLFCVDRGDGYPMIKVLDFGISKFVATTADVARTDRHEILGSPRYMSPEQIDSACGVDHRTDIWSFGVILYEAIAGRTPFNGDQVPELWRKIRHEEPDALPTIRGDCPTELWAVVNRCLRKDKSQRFTDLGELAQALAPHAPERSRASIARIRWTVEANSQSSTRPSTSSGVYDRAVTPTGRGHSRWWIAGSIASSVGIGLSLAALRRGFVPAVQPPSPTSQRIETFRASPVDLPAIGTVEGWTAVPATQAPAIEKASSGPVPEPRLPKVKRSGSRHSNIQGMPRTTDSSSPEPSVAPPLGSAAQGVGSEASGIKWHMDPERTRK
jgi:eukaryotic-like serine/threonine-protein kinase